MKIKNLLIIAIVIGILGLVIHLITGTSASKTESGHDSLSEGTALESINEEYPWGDEIPDNVIVMKKVRIIEKITIDKNPVCSGETFKVTVKGTNPLGSGSVLNYRIGMARGNPAILRYRYPGEKKIHIYAKAGETQVDHRVVTVTVKECPDRPHAEIIGTFSKATPGQANFEVTELKGLEGDLKYTWDFGNGKGTFTDKGFASHNYGSREQNSYSTTYIVKVKVADRHGTTAEGRVAMTLINTQWISTQMGNPMVPITYNRFPIRKGDTYQVYFKMKNIFDERVKFSDATVEFDPCFDEDSLISQNFHAHEFITKTSLNGKSSHQDVFTIGKSLFPYPTCTIKVKLTGTLGEKKIVSSKMYITIPMSREWALRAIKNKKVKVIEDKDTISKIRKAQALLGKKTITLDDITRLEREGKL